MKAKATRNIQASKAKGYMNPISRNNIGSRTGKDVKAGKNIRRFDDGIENFDDYWTDSDGEVTSEINIESSKNDPTLVDGCQEANVYYLKHRAIPSMSPFSAASADTRVISSRSSGNVPHSLASCREASMTESGNISAASQKLASVVQQNTSAFPDQTASMSDSMQATVATSHHSSPTENEDMAEDVSCKFPSVQITPPDDDGSALQNGTASVDDSRLKVSGSSLNVAGDKLGSITKSQVTNDTMLKQFKTKKRLHFSEESDSHVDQSQAKLNTKACSKGDSTFDVSNETGAESKAVTSDKKHSTRRQNAVDSSAQDSVNNSVVTSNAKKGSNRRKLRGDKNAHASAGVGPHDVDDIHISESFDRNVAAETDSSHASSAVSDANKQMLVHVSRSLSKTQDVGQLAISATSRNVETISSSKRQTKNTTYHGESVPEISDSETEFNPFVNLGRSRNKSHHSKEPQDLVVLETDSSVFSVAPEIAEKKNHLQGKSGTNNRSRIKEKKSKSPMKNISSTYNGGKRSKGAKNSPLITSGTQTLVSESADERHVTSNTSTLVHSPTSIAANLNKSQVLIGNQSKNQDMKHSSLSHAEMVTSSKQQRKNITYQGEMSDSDTEGNQFISLAMSRSKYHSRKDAQDVIRVVDSSVSTLATKKTGHIKQRGTKKGLARKGASLRKSISNSPHGSKNDCNKSNDIEETDLIEGQKKRLKGNKVKEYVGRTHGRKGKSKDVSETVERLEDIDKGVKGRSASRKNVQQEVKSNQFVKEVAKGRNSKKALALEDHNSLRTIQANKRVLIQPKRKPRKIPVATKESLKPALTGRSRRNTQNVNEDVKEQMSSNYLDTGGDESCSTAHSLTKDTSKVSRKRKNSEENSADMMLNIDKPCASNQQKNNCRKLKQRKGSTQRRLRSASTESEGDLSKAVNGQGESQLLDEDMDEQYANKEQKPNKTSRVVKASRGRKNNRTRGDHDLSAAENDVLESLHSDDETAENLRLSLHVNSLPPTSDGDDNSFPFYDPLRSGVSHRQRRRTSVLDEAPVEKPSEGTQKCLEDVGVSPKQTKSKRKKRVTISNFIFMTPNSKESRKSDAFHSILKVPASSAYRSINSSPQHIFEETVSQTPVASQHNLHPKIILPDNSPHQNLRRSKRTRVAPLQSYKSERIIYRRQSGMFVIDHIEPAPIDAIMQKKQRIHNLKVLQRKKTAKKSRIPVISRRLSIHGQIPDEEKGKSGDDFLVVNPDTNEEVICECVSHRESWQYSNEAELKPSPADPFIMACSFRHPVFRSGELRLRPFAKKPTQSVQNNSFVFAIIYGKLFVTIHSNQFIVESGDHFFVPRGNTYSIQNLRDDEAMVTYFQMCDV